MDDKHIILYNYYLKYNGGNLSVAKKIFTKLPSVAKSILIDVINDLPGRIKDEFRDRIATNLLQGKNPIMELNTEIQNRIYNNLIKDGTYSINEINKLFNKPLIKYNVIKELIPKSYAFLNLSNQKNYNSENLDDFNELHKSELYGGSVYKQKYYKYKYKK